MIYRGTRRGMSFANLRRRTRGNDAATILKEAIHAEHDRPLGLRGRLAGVHDDVGERATPRQTRHLHIQRPGRTAGVTLPAGTYLFRVPTPNRNIIQVLNGDGTKIYGTFFAISAHRNVRPENPEVRFMETAATKPHAIRTWWYPGDSTG